MTSPGRQISVACVMCICLVGGSSGTETAVRTGHITGTVLAGTPVPMSEVGLPEVRTTVSDDEGHYTLYGFEPANIYRVAGYLNGGSLDAIGALHTQVEIKVEAPGLRQDKAKVPKVPLISETQLVPGRRLWQALAELAAKTGPGDGWKGMKNPPLPASRGSAITGADIVLERG